MFPFSRFFSRFQNQAKQRALAGKRRARSSRLDCFDVLEPRRTLAGNVAATVLDGNLYLVGDNTSNQIELIVRDGRAIVNGLEGTTVNGGASFQIGNSNSIGGKMFAWLLGGDDTLILRNGVAFPDSVEIHGGAGEDQIGFEAVTITNDAFLGTDEFADTIAMNGTTVGGNLWIWGGSADDVISLKSVTVRNTLILEAGNGHDAVELRDVKVNGRSRLDSGKGNDTLNLVDSVFAGNSSVELGRGNDVLRSQQSRFDVGMDLRGNSGMDMVEFSGTTAIPASFKFHGGRGEDSITGPNSTALTGNQRVSSANLNAVDSSVVNARLNDPVTGVVPRAAAAQEILRQQTIGELTLTAQLDETLTVQSSGIRVTGVQNFPVEGTSIANALIEISRDGDGLFNDGSAIVGADGKYSIPVQLVSNATNKGVNSIVVRATDSDGNTLTQNVRVHFVQGSMVRMTSDIGTIDFELFDSATPQTVANFLGYFGRYANSIVHRSINVATSGLDVIQGGGFVVDGSGVVSPIATDAPVPGEFSASRSNIRGTLAMALPSGNPNGATDQWFINLANHSTVLDPQQFTVFGRVIGDGLVVADAIHALNKFHLARGLDTVADPSLGALTDVPLQNYTTFTQTLDGTVALTEGSNTLTGTGTSFLTNVSADGRIQVGDTIFVVDEILSDTEIRLATNSLVTVTGEQIQINARPTKDNYVSFSTTTKLVLPTAT